MKDWTIHYVKAKDIFLNKLKNYDINEDVIEFDFGEYKHFYLFQEELTKEIIEKANKFEKKTIVCEKNTKNFDFLCNNFDLLAEMNNLIIIFLSKDKKNKLLINPKAHKYSSDPETLKQGLESIWNSN